MTPRGYVWLSNLSHGASVDVADLVGLVLDKHGVCLYQTDKRNVSIVSPVCTSTTLSVCLIDPPHVVFSIQKPSELGGGGGGGGGGGIRLLQYASKLAPLEGIKHNGPTEIQMNSRSTGTASKNRPKSIPTQ